MAYLFTSESVSEGHPDKIADQISDALLDNFLAFDPESKVACETMVTTGQVVLAGEVKSHTYVDLQSIAREVINKIGYTKGEYKFSGDSCGVISLIHEPRNDVRLRHHGNRKLYALGIGYFTQDFGGVGQFEERRNPNSIFASRCKGTGNY